MEIIFVELPHEGGEITVFKMFRQDLLGKFIILDVMSIQFQSEISNLLTSRTTKLSPVSPHFTILSYDGSSSILEFGA